MQWLLAAAGVFLILVGVVLFIKMPHGGGGPTKIKLPGIEAEIPVATLVPLVLGVVLLLVGATRVTRDAHADSGPSLQPSANVSPGPLPSAVQSHHQPRLQATNSCRAAADVALAALKWAPADCSNSAGAPIRIAGCEEHRSLGWLTQQLKLLRAAQVKGFSALPEEFELQVADAYGKKNWTLRVMAQGQPLYNVGVGYNISSGAKDGCLSLTKDGKAATPFACMDTSGQWWIRRQAELCHVSGTTL